VKTRRSLYQSIRKTLLVTALPLLPAACSSDGRNEADQAASLPEPSIEAVPVPISGHTAFKQSPIAAFHLTVDQSVSLWTATRSQRISCVRDKGFTEYNGELIDEAPPDGSTDAITQLAGPWGYLGARAATEQGFAPGPRAHRAGQSGAGGAQSVGALYGERRFRERRPRRACHEAVAAEAHRSAGSG
jgi:hypothetical protein